MLLNGAGSFWLNQAGLGTPTRAPLEGNVTADVAIIGAGLTGLWTAYWLKERRPNARVVVLEAHSVGYGASGRNGGWLSSKPVGTRRRQMAAGASKPELLETETLLRQAVSEVPAIFAEAELDISLRTGGWLHIARTESQKRRLLDQAKAESAWGGDPTDYTFHEGDDLTQMIRVSGGRAGLLNTQSIVVDPAQLVSSLATLCEQRGVEIHEQSRVTDVQTRRVRTASGEVQSRLTVIATEGYTAQFQRWHRSILPMFSSMLVTEPLPQSAWDAIGWNGFAGLSGAAHMYFFAQRTPDGRIAIGGRGMPYRWRSRFDRDGVLDQRTIEALKKSLRTLFPQVDLAFSHAWCGVLGVSRDWSPFIAYSEDSSLVRVGGYAGQGVSGAYVAARCVADRFAGQETQYSQLPWVRPAPRNWEIEPLRWLGSRGVYGLYGLADRVEGARETSQRTSVLAKIATAVSGRQ